MNQMLMIALILSLTFQAGAQEATPSPQALPQPPASTEVIAEMSARVRQSMDQIQSLMNGERYGEALSAARSLLDEARTKVGFSPRSRRVEIFEVPRGTFASEHRSIGKTLSTFSIETQNDIFASLENQRGGLYLDLLNLLKRVNLIYMQAFYRVVKSDTTGGALMQEDATKIRNDLLSVMVIPIYLKDAGSGSPLLVFDDEVSNTDQNYLFNREVKKYLILIAPELGYRNNSAKLETDIIASRNAMKQSVRDSFIRSESSKAGIAVPDAAAPGAEQSNSQDSSRLSNLQIYQTGSFQSCVRSFRSADYNQEYSERTCYRVERLHNFSESVFNGCFRNYRSSDYNAEYAARTCLKNLYGKTL